MPEPITAPARRLRSARLPVLVAAVALLVGACAGAAQQAGPASSPAPAPTAPATTPPSPPSTEPAPESAPESSAPAPEPATEPATDRGDARWRAVEELIPADGTITPEVALTAYATVYGPTSGAPGVDVPEQPAIIRSGSEVLRWVSAHWEQLPPESRADIQAAATETPPSGLRGLRTGQQPVDRCGYVVFAPSNAPEIEPWRQAVQSALATIEHEWGPLGIPVELSFGAKSNVYADASPIAPDCAAPATGCHIRIHRGLVQADASEHAPTLVHELIHCFQLATVPVERFSSIASWQVEGIAEWAAVHFGGPRPDDLSWWTRYLDTPEESLYARTYSANGFFHTLEALGTDPWQGWRQAALLNNRSAYDAYVGAVRQQFEDSWASGFVRDPGLGEAWDQYPALAPASQPALAESAVISGSDLRVEAAPVSSRLERVDVSQADVVRLLVGGAGRGRLAWATGEETVLAGTPTPIERCALAEGCVCPDGTAIEAYAGDSVLVAISGIEQLTEVIVIGLTLEEACNGASPTVETGTIPAALHVDPCVVGTWQNGAFTIPGPDPAYTLTGGEGAVITVTDVGGLEVDLGPMQPMVAYDPQLDATVATTSSGVGRATITAEAGAWTVSAADIASVLGRLEISGPATVSRDVAGGPGLFVALMSGTYECAANALSISTPDPVTGTAVTVGFTRT